MSLRVTGGVLRGRRMRVPGAGVRPSQDRVRAALFSSLGAIVPGARVLDLFAGSGAYGIEAVSRGAAGVTWVERDPRVWRVLRANVTELCGRRPADACRCGDALRFVKRSSRSADGGRFSLVIADPPYDNAGDLLKKLLLLMVRTDIFDEHLTVVFEQSIHTPDMADDHWRLDKSRRYGETRICCYRRRIASASTAID